MFELDESVEQGAIVRVIGVGSFGLRVVGNMVGRIQNVECMGGVKKDSVGPDNVDLNPLIERCLNNLAGISELTGLLKPNTQNKYFHPLPTLQKDKEKWVASLVAHITARTHHD